MNIKDAINYPVDVLEKTITIGTDVYKFKGTPNASLYADTLLLPPDKCRQLSEHWGRVTGQHISENLVKHILAVSYTIQPDPTNLGPDGNPRPYDQADIAAFAAKAGPEFMQLVGAAYFVSGMATEEVNGELKPKLETAFEDVAKGNSEPQVATD